ncbi:integral membrane protein [Seiridium cupressi]
MATIDNRGPQVRAVASTVFALAFVALLLRCYVRLRIAKAFGWDDWFMVAAMVSFTFNTATCLAGVEHGTGRHYWDLEPHDLSAAMMYWWYCYLTYATTMILSKASIAFFLVRIIPDRVHRWIVYVALGLSIFCGLAFFFVALFQCSPVEFFWTRTGPGSCISIDIIIDIVYTYSTLSIVTDFTFSILPIWLVWHLHMDKKTKVALIPILSMACAASCAVAVRLAYVENFRTDNFLYATTDIAIWSQAEQGLAIAAASLATLQPLLRKALNKLGLSSGPHSGPASSDGIRTFGQGSGKSTYSRRTPRSVLSISTFAKIDENHEVESAHGHANDKEDIELGSRNDMRTSFRKDGVDYRVSIHANQNHKWALPALGDGSQDDLQGITKKTTYRVAQGVSS